MPKPKVQYLVSFAGAVMQTTDSYESAIVAAQALDNVAVAHNIRAETNGGYVMAEIRPVVALGELQVPQSIWNASTALAASYDTYPLALTLLRDAVPALAGLPYHDWEQFVDEYVPMPVDTLKRAAEDAAIENDTVGERRLGGLLRERLAKGAA